MSVFRHLDSPARASGKPMIDPPSTIRSTSNRGDIPIDRPRPPLAPRIPFRIRLSGSVALDGIPSIRRAHIGRRVTHGRPYEQLMTVDYEYAAIFEFDTVADLTAYLAHGAHDALGTLFFEAFEVALIYGYEMHSGAADWLL